MKFQDKRMNIMVNKIGLPEKVAEWCLSKSKKYCVWVANQIADKQCYRVNWFLESQTLQQVQMLNNFSNEVDTILDWKKEVQGNNLNDYNFKKAILEANKFNKSLFVPNNNGLKNTNVILDCGEYKWVQLITEPDCKEEGSTMGHCIGNSSHSQRISSGGSIAFSLRDKYNRPHLTIEANSKNKQVFEFKGHSNSSPKSEYLDCFVELNNKYNFSTITDGTKSAFEQNINAVSEIAKVNSTFFSFAFQLRLGLLPFKEGESYLDEIQIATSKELILPDNVHFYNSITISTNDKVVLGENLLIGGDLNLQVKKSNLIIKNNIGVGGNLKLGKGIFNEHKDIENISYFGQVITS
tara:strand:+ start:1081 stop:2136 length:1056 start_codon:yes stop_codon:yes gene_type:complete